VNGSTSDPDPETDRSATLELRLNGSGGIEEAAGAAVRAIAGSAGVHPERITRLRAVVEELVREAGRRPRAAEGDDVVVRVCSEAGMLRVEVADLALPVSPAESRRSPSRRLAALGFVDELHIHAHGRAGNLAECALRLEPIEAELGGERQLEADAEQVSAEQAASIEIRAMQPADAIGLVRCVYRCYGYTYIDSMLYEPRHIAQALRSGRMSSVVAVTDDGTVVGHCATFAERQGDPVPESGKLVVDPRFRGHGLAGRMATLRHSLVAEQGARGTWAEAVTMHPFSQREVIALGGAEVGLLLGGTPADTAMAGIEGAAELRRAVLVVYTPLTGSARGIHPPARHRELLAELAGRLELERTHEPGEAPEGGRTRLSTRVLTGESIAHIRVASVGADLRSRVADELEGLDAFDLVAVQVDISLADPGAGWGAEELEPLGLSFAAWIPDFLADGDALRLQRVGGHPVDAEHIVCARPEGEAVRDYVIAEWHRVRRGERAD
jgi:hypothetical protein